MKLHRRSALFAAAVAFCAISATGCASTEVTSTPVPTEIVPVPTAQTPATTPSAVTLKSLCDRVPPSPEGWVEQTRTSSGGDGGSILDDCDITAERPDGATLSTLVVQTGDAAYVQEFLAEMDAARPSDTTVEEVAGLSVVTTGSETVVWGAFDMTMVLAYASDVDTARQVAADLSVAFTTGN